MELITTNLHIIASAILLLFSALNVFFYYRKKTSLNLQVAAWLFFAAIIAFYILQGTFTFTLSFGTGAI
jgi:hypothetical protein